MTRATVTATYPCCGKPCTVPNTAALPSEVVTRRHFCDRSDDTGAMWQVTRSRLAHGPVEVNRVVFLDLASSEAERTYGRRRVPHREAPGW